jgi:hypothetical protein
MYQELAAKQFGSQSKEHLLVWDSGKPILRTEIQAVLEKAAAAEGVDPGTIGSHSLRFGGASALWAAYKDSAMVRRWGRWASDAFHTYLWEASSAATGVAEAMATADITVT